MKQAIFFPEILEEQNTKTDLFKSALSPEAFTIFKLNRKLKEFKHTLENMIFYSEFGIEERAKEEQVTIPEDLLQSVEDILYDIKWNLEQIDILKNKLFQGKIL